MDLRVCCCGLFKDLWWPWIVVCGGLLWLGDNVVADGLLLFFLLGVFSGMQPNTEKEIIFPKII